MSAMTRTRPRSAGRSSRGTLPYEIRQFDKGAKAHLIVASGELDLHAAPSMRAVLAALAAEGRTHLVIDMSSATFIDSAMIGVLAGHLRRTRVGAGSLAVVCSDENILRTLEIAGIERELQIIGRLSDAVVERVAALPSLHEHSKLVSAPRMRELLLAPDPSELAFARGFAAAAARRAGLNPQQQYNLAVATNEAVANAIEHGEPCRDGSIVMWVDERRGSITVGVRSGGDFVLEPLPPGTLHERGRGLKLMSRMVDEISVQREDAQTVVQLSIHC
jgi:anti-sigma B factor antagonist